jgi:hypothetical protein
MSRAACCLLLLTSLAAPAATPPPDAPIRLAVSPAGVPAPSFKYQLLPPRGEQTPGNAATLYYRAYSLFVENQSLLQEFHDERWWQWAEMPLDDLPKDEVGQRLGRFRYFLREVELGARCRDCDWQISGRSEGMGLLLPDVQGFRRVGALLAVRTRYQVLQDQWDEAVRTLQTAFALARHLTEGPSLVHVLVGLAIAQTCCQQVDAFVQRPGAPNLYWALTRLPRPFANPEPALEEERTILERTLPWLKQLDGPPMTPEQVQAGEVKIRAMLDDFNVRKANLAQRLARVALLERGQEEARKALIARGVSPAHVEAMPAIQVLGLDAYRRYQDALDEAIQWAHVAGGFRQPGYKKAQDRLRSAAERLDALFFNGLLKGLGGDGMPNLEGVYGGIGRLDRRIAALRCVEAVRLYAAAHDGKAPARLADVTEAPAPDDPATGRPFEYKAEGNKATLTARPASGARATPADTLVVEVTVRR